MIETLWKWGHIWFWLTSPCHSSSCICHFIGITPKSFSVPCYRISPLPAITHPMLWIHVDNLHWRPPHHHILERYIFDILNLYGWLFVFHKIRFFETRIRLCTHFRIKSTEPDRIHITVQLQFISVLLRMFHYLSYLCTMLMQKSCSCPFEDYILCKCPKQINSYWFWSR